jgi:nucleotide-binding universal stress UspA family protein
MDYKRKLKHILIATDLSETSDFALARAIEIANMTKANLTVLHVVKKMNLDIFLDNTLKKILPKSLFLTTEEYKEQLVKEKFRSLFKRVTLQLKFYNILRKIRLIY